MAKRKKAERQHERIQAPLREPMFAPINHLDRLLSALRAEHPEMTELSDIEKTLSKLDGQVQLLCSKYASKKLTAFAIEVVADHQGITANHARDLFGARFIVEIGGRRYYAPRDTQGEWSFAA